MTLRTATLLLALASITPLATAHGNEEHKTAGPVKMEQKNWGIAGDPQAVSRTIEIGMTDAMRFTPDRLEVRQGETIRFVHTNSGKVMHEFVLGTKKDLDEHAALMKKFPGMEHQEPYMAHVAPGQRGEIVWQFNRAGEFDFACLLPGHYEAGMVGKIKVAGTTVAQGMDHGKMGQGHGGTMGMQNLPPAEAEVRRIDKDTGKITLRHGEIKNMDMPPMTMVFTVRDKAMLDGIAVGDKVEFTAVHDKGEMRVESIRPLKP